MQPFRARTRGICSGPSWGCMRANGHHDAMHPGCPPGFLGCSHGKWSSLLLHGQPPLPCSFLLLWEIHLKGGSSSQPPRARAPSTHKPEQSFHRQTNITEVGTRNSKDVLCTCPNSALPSLHPLQGHTPVHRGSACGFGSTGFGTDLVAPGGALGC